MPARTLARRKRAPQGKSLSVEAVSFLGLGIGGASGAPAIAGAD
jgi:hypothetical protein